MLIIPLVGIRCCKIMKNQFHCKICKINMQKKRLQLNADAFFAYLSGRFILIHVTQTSFRLLYQCLRYIVILFHPYNI